MRGVGVFHKLFAWLQGSIGRKASKCKRLIRQVQDHLLIQKTKRHSVITHSRSDIARLLNDGMIDIALNRAEQLYKDQCLYSAYHLLEQSCDRINAKIRDFDKLRDMSNDDVKEAVSSLIFAASRCGELPELNRIRCLFKQHLGDEFELQAGNCVSPQIMRDLSTNPIPDDVKLELINEIAKEYSHNDLVLPRNDEHIHFIPKSPKELQVCNLYGKRHESITSNNNNEVEVKASKMEDMLRRIRSKFCLSPKIIKTVDSQMKNQEEDAASNRKINKTVDFQMKNQEEDTASNRTWWVRNGSPTVQKTPIVCIDKIEEELSSTDDLELSFRIYLNKESLIKPRHALKMLFEERSLLDR